MPTWRRGEGQAGGSGSLNPGPHLPLHLLQQLALGPDFLLDGVVHVEQHPVPAVLVRVLQGRHQLLSALVCVAFPSLVLLLQVLVLGLLPTDHLLLQQLQTGGREGKADRATSAGY